MEIDRRSFLKMSVAAGAAASLDMKFFSYTGEAAASQKTGAETITRSTCSPNCTGACGFNIHVTDGRISTIIQSADYPGKSDELGFYKEVSRYAQQVIL